jgi:hypothetical protein
MGEIEAIPTKYKGTQFRSRLEARWSIFFDELGIRWDYEPKSFNLGGLWYLPDFWLPEFKSWIEIKGVYPNSEEKLKAIRLQRSSGYPVFLFGSLPRITDERYGIGYLPVQHNYCTCCEYCWWTNCLRCGQILIFACLQTFGSCVCNRMPKESFSCDQTSSAFYAALNHRF